MAKPTLTLDLNHGAISLLKQLLASAGWCDNPADSYRAGQLLTDAPELEIPKPPRDVIPALPQDLRAAWIQAHPTEVEANEAAALAWVRTPVALPCTEKQRETMKTCFAHFQKGKALPNGEVTNRLIAQLGLAPED